ncbi:IS30 family transposase [Nocardiopsis sp. CNS-639]|uniref:IS30 family transposase n=2 Tax=Nocardiopsis sp. CNS-639 TaxID=1169153 RepID=UPI00039FE37C
MREPQGWTWEPPGPPPPRSLRTPSLRREAERQFWHHITQGMTSENAAVMVGASRVGGNRWFRERGGMATFLLTPLQGRYLSFQEREEIAVLHAQDVGVRQIARQINRDPATVSRELRRNGTAHRGRLYYRAFIAQKKAEGRAQRPKPAKLLGNEPLRQYVQERLCGHIQRSDGTPVPGPRTPPWKGRNRPRRKDRRWATSWSPEQISRRLRRDFPDDESMRISHEAIYQALYVQGRGALKRELVACLRTGRALRVPRARARARAGSHVAAQVMISQRPAEAADRAVPGHWEGDLILGTGRSAIGTLVERSTRFTMLVHLPGWGRPGGSGAGVMRQALVAQMVVLPEQLRRSLTWDQGGELAQHVRFRVQTGIAVYFADPHSPWQRGTNENTNGLLRQYFPKGTDLARWSAQDLQAVAAALNGRPRKTLGWKTPAEALEEQLALLQQAGVATTD